MNSSRAELHRSIIAIGTYVLLVATVLITIDDPGFRGSFFSADDLYLPTLFEDLFRWGGRLRDWRLTPAPYYFPDMLLYAAARVATGSIEWSQYLTGIAQVALFVAALWNLVRSLQPTAAHPALFVGPAMVVLIALHCTGSLPMLSPLLHLTQHGGAALGTVVVLRFTLARPANSMFVAPVLFVASGLLGLSDPLFTASCCAALLVVGAVSAIPVFARKLFGADDPDRVVTRNRALAAAIGGFVGAAYTENIQTRLKRLFLKEYADHTQSSLSAVLRDLVGDAWAISLWLGSGLALACLILFAFRTTADRHLRKIALWYIAAVFFTIPAIAGYGTYQNAASARYYAVVYAATLVVMCGVIARMLARQSVAASIERWRALAAGATVAGAVLATLVLANGLNDKRIAQYASPWRETARCVQTILEQEQVDTILTDYWKAKPLMLFSDGAVRAVQMRAKLRAVYHWINSRNWYRGERTFGVIGVNDLSPDVIRSRYGAPARIEHCGDIELFVYRDGAATKLSRDMGKLFARFTRK
jgi:hypothetical protein